MRNIVIPKVDELVAELRHSVLVLERENDALKASRDSYMRENLEKQKQIAYWRRRLSGQEAK